MASGRQSPPRASEMPVAVCEYPREAHQEEYFHGLPGRRLTEELSFLAEQEHHHRERYQGGCTDDQGMALEPQKHCVVLKNPESKSPLREALPEVCTY